MGLSLLSHSSTVRLRQEPEKCQSNVANALDVPSPMLLKSAGDCFLQDIPCTELFTNIPLYRDCCSSCSGKGLDLSPLSFSCRFMHLRRLSISRNGGLKVFSTEDQVKEEIVLQPAASATETVLNPEPSPYILGHVGDPFCDIVLAEQRPLEKITESYDGSIAFKVPFGEKEETCDSCHCAVFHIHWVCLRCGCFYMNHKKSTRTGKVVKGDVRMQVFFKE
ncbi:lysine-specific demethylase 3A-B-like [Heterodontus francisci]|uniref:lysine-specific demethylase 3A-B-like n=1 Tax=Heterodontus francisci TaxID=7792 RepID=UPI00355C84FF